MEMLDIAQSEGADAIILHARTRSQMFGGRIHYEALAEMVSAAKIPVIGNGDVSSLETLRLMQETGVDGVMIGRAMMHAPWVFAALKEGKEPEGYLQPAELYTLLLRLYSLMKEHAGDNPNKQMHYLNIIKKYSVWFSKGLPEATTFRTMVYKNIDEAYFLNLLEEFYAHI
jgi:tRNA-dihydrouridine synthase